jgi:hypothetical protein
MDYLLSQLATSAIDWKTFGNWVDTEGHLSSVITRMKKGDRVGLRRDHELAIYQDEKDVLEALGDFLVGSGLSRPYYYFNERTGVWALKVYRIEDIEKIIQMIEPFILTRKKREQVAKFRRFRSERYKRFPREAN